MAAMAVASTSFAPSVSVSFIGLRAGRALARAPAVAFPRLRSMPLRIRAEAEGKGSTTFDDVQKIIAHQLAVDMEKITIKSEFVELGADSLDTVEIMMALEEKFEIQLDAEKGETIKTVQDVVGLIEETVAAGKKA